MLVAGGLILIGILLWEEALLDEMLHKSAIRRQWLKKLALKMLNTRKGCDAGLIFFFFSNFICLCMVTNFDLSEGTRIKK